MEENGNIYLLVNYIIDSITTLEALRRQYPNLIILRITPGIYTVQVPQGAEAEFESLQENLRYIDIPLLYGLNAQQALETSNISQLHNYPYGALTGSGILIGFVDTGIDYTNTYFQNADGTSRIVSIWDQTIPGNPPEEFGYGSVYNQEQLSAALKSENPLSVVPTRDTNGHGTFLAGVAAGNDQSGADTFVGAAPDAGIIMVKLRPASQNIRQTYLINEDVEAYQTNDILTGLQYIMNTASALNRPLVICLGFGCNFGAHDGTNTIERYLENMGVTNGVIVVSAAGNETNSGHHYRGQIQAGQSQDVEVNVGENESGFVLSLYANIASRLYISVRSPLGQVISRIPIINQQNQNFKFNLERTILDVTYLYTDPFTGSEQISIRLTAPTPGIWTLTISAENAIDGNFNIWLPRRGFINDTTYFLQPDPSTTVQIPSTGKHLIVVGAYDATDDSIYIESGRGPTIDNITKPDIVAPGVNVQGPRVGGGLTSFTGTSTATAITAGASALLLEWAIVNQNLLEINTRIARGIFIRGARRLNSITYPNNIEGYGRLDLQNSISTL
ncbi:MAG: S8 family peptidase [Cellulosilyticum sp.]|nr:S8 family peptidase [Cellulosilyticum sp.]